MGLASSQDEYCARGDEALQGIEQIKKVANDILIQGETAQEHLNTIVAVLNRCREHGITLNPKKVQLLQSAVRYVGYILSSDGIKADPTNIEAISEFPAPTNITELRSFMGVANQLGGFTHLLSEAAGPLQDLLKPKNVFLWSPQHEEAFTKTKEILCSPHILVVFDPNLQTMLQTDASRLKGLGFALLQKHQVTWKLVQVGSRFITETESNYAMVELELLAVVWATRKCRIYLQNLPSFKLIVDHKPLESILNTQTLDMVDNPRIQRHKKTQCFYIPHHLEKRQRPCDPRRVVTNTVPRPRTRRYKRRHNQNDPQKRFCNSERKKPRSHRRNIYRSNAGRLKRKYSAGRSSTTINHCY